jgi:hypothetical protein
MNNHARIFSEVFTMSDKTKSGPPPYATWSSFFSFLNKLRDATIPSRIDPSVFGNASGSLSYSIIATLKFLKLISADGLPLPAMNKLVKASDEERKPLIAALVKEAYPSFFGGDIDITAATAAQFDEHIRGTFESSGSTVDKIAGFFIGAATFAGIDMSALIKARKQIAASATAAKSKKQRKADDDDDGHRDPPPVVTIEPKALEYQLIDLMKTDGVGEEEQKAIWTLVRFLATK